MANGAFKFKDNSGNVVSFISGSGSNISFSGGTLDLSGMTSLTLGGLTMSGSITNALTASSAPSYLLTSSFNTYSSSLATTGSNTFKGNQTISGSIVSTVTPLVSGSSQITYSGLTGIPSGIISGSSQLTSSYDGRYVLSGSITQTTWDNIASKPSGIASGSSQIDITGTTGYSTFSSSISTSIGGLSSSVAITTSGLSSSILGLSSSVATTTSGLSSTIGSLSSSVAITTSGLSSSILSLSSSVATTTSGLSSSIGSLSSSVATTTLGTRNRVDSIETTTGSLNTFTSSASGRLTSLEGVTGSISTLNTYTGSNNTIIGTLQTSTSSLNSYTSSNTTNINAIHTSTGSFKSFTSSFDTAIGLSGANVTVKGNLTVSGTSTIIDSTTVAIGDNIIQLNGTGATNAGLVVRDATAPNTLSGSFLWDTTNDKWIAGTLGSEDDVVLKTATQTLTNKTIDGSQLVALSVANGKLTNSSITIAGTSTSLGGTISATTILSGTGTISSSLQLPSGIVSSSAQTIANLPAGTVSGSSQVLNGTTIHSGSFFNGISVVSGSAQIDFTGIINKPTLVSGSSQITFLGLSSIPSGLVSGSSQVLSGTGIWSGSAQLPSGVVSGSAQTIANLPSGTVSGSSQVLFTGLSSVPSGLVSGSSQIAYGSITGVPSGLVSGSSQISYGSISGVPSGLVSGSSQISFGSISGVPSGLVSGSLQIIAGLPSGTVSGSSQIAIASTTGFGTYINQAVLTTSSPTFAGLTSSGIVTIGVIQGLKATGFGYDTNSYKVLQVGSTTSNQSLAFGVDVSGNSNGSFSGLGSEYVWKNAGSFITPNASNNGYNTLFSWNSSGQLTFPNSANFSSTISASNFSGTSSGTNTGDQTNISGYATSLNGYANQTVYTILDGPANGPVIKVRYDSATANRYIDIGSKDGNGVYSEGLKLYNGSTMTWLGYTVYHSGNVPTWNQNTTGTASNITAYTINQSVGTSNSPTFVDTTLTGGLTIGGSLSRGTYTAGSNYVTGADNIVLKGNASGVSGIFFESEKDGTNINHPSDFGFIQFHPYGIGGSSGEANRLVIGVSNDADDLIVMNPVDINGLKLRVGVGTTEYTIYHSGNVPTWNQNTTGTASNITAYTINQSVGTGNAPTFAGGTINGSLYVNANNDITTLAGSLTLYSSGNATTSMMMFKNTTGLGYGNHGAITGTYNTYFVMDTTDRGWVWRNATTSTNIASISNTGTFTVNGNVMPTANGTQNLGGTSNRWNTVFTSDLSLSNGIGDYTIVEGENDLFLYNNKQNKVYKFMLQEVNANDATPKRPE